MQFFKENLSEMKLLLHKLSQAEYLKGHDCDVSLNQFNDFLTLAQHILNTCRMTTFVNSDPLIN